MPDEALIEEFRRTHKPSYEDETEELIRGIRQGTWVLERFQPSRAGFSYLRDLRAEYEEKLIVAEPEERELIQATLLNLNEDVLNFIPHLRPLLVVYRKGNS